MSDHDANELLARIIERSNLMLPGSTYKREDWSDATFERYASELDVLALHTECLAGRLPSEYLRALAGRARDEAPKGFFGAQYRDMARILEAWSNE